MKTASFSIAILNFFSRHGQYFHPTKDQPRTRPSSTFLYICYNFRQIFCTNVIQFFSVENMGHNQLQKCTKYHLVSLLNEKQGSTFANFLDLFYPLTLLTNSALETCQWSNVAWACPAQWVFLRWTGETIATREICSWWRWISRWKWFSRWEWLS